MNMREKLEAELRQLVLAVVESEEIGRMGKREIEVRARIMSMWGEMEAKLRQYEGYEHEKEVALMEMVKRDKEELEIFRKAHEETIAAERRTAEKQVAEEARSWRIK